MVTRSDELVRRSDSATQDLARPLACSVGERTHDDGDRQIPSRTPWSALTTARHARRLAAAFPHLSGPDLREVARGLERERFGRGDLIVREGDAANRFYLIESGVAEATQSSSGGETHVTTMDAGDFFGEVGMIETGTRTASVRAVSEVRALSFGCTRLQALIRASQPTARDLTEVVTARNVPAEPRADRAPLPSWTGRLQRVLKAPWAMHYNRLIVLVLGVNALLAVYGVTHWGQHGSALHTVALVAQINLALAIIFRQPYVLNALGWVATRPPVTWPLRVRWALGKFYHFGGLHVGTSLAGTLWYLTYVALLVHAVATGSASPASLVIPTLVATLIVVMVVQARPSNRHKRHNTFEAAHRFCGWTVVVLMWLSTVLTTSAAAGSAFAALFGAASFWILLATTCCSAWPWLMLRKVPVRVERPSSHLAILHVDQDFKPPVGTTRAISRSPLYGWHPFANVPVPTGSDARGYRMTISRAGDWTGELIDDPPEHVWVRGIPTVGVINIKKLFSKVVIVATGSGIGPALGHLLAAQTPSQLVWSTRDPVNTYGQELVDEILTAQPEAIIWNTDELGRPDLLRLAYRAYVDSGAEAVICISNKKLTWSVVHGLERRGIPAFGPVWDS